MFVSCVLYSKFSSDWLAACFTVGFFLKVIHPHCIYNTLRQNTTFISQTISYILRPIYSQHQADRKNKKGLAISLMLALYKPKHVAGFAEEKGERVQIFGNNLNGSKFFAEGN